MHMLLKSLYDIIIFTDSRLKILILECPLIFEGKCITRRGKYVCLSIALIFKQLEDNSIGQ